MQHACIGKAKIKACIKSVVVRRRSSHQRISEAWKSAEKPNSSAAGAFFGPSESKENQERKRNDRKQHASEKCC